MTYVVDVNVAAILLVVVMTIGIYRFSRYVKETNLNER